MYVTRPLSLYRKFPSRLSAQAPSEEGPYSGYLVISDEQAEAEDTFCWGTCKMTRVKKLPFPQDKLSTIVHSSDLQETIVTKVLFIPVLDQPLSSNRYYVIRAKGKYKGQACTSSRETDMGCCCFDSVINDVKPKPFDQRNIYQKFKIHRHHEHSFFATCAATDGLPPKFLKKKGWEVKSSTLLFPSQVTEALGIDNSLRPLLPDFIFPIGNNKRSVSIVVGRWFCPFVFVKEESRLRHQMKKSVLYEMSLEQWWEEVFSCENEDNNNDSTRNVVNVNTSVTREVNKVFGLEGVKDDKISHGGFIWFRGYDRKRVGLSIAIVEKMKWLQEEGGWVNTDGREKQVRVERVEQVSSESVWKRFGCYVLVESFVLTRMDGTSVLRSDFRHTHKLQCKWEF